VTSKAGEAEDATEGKTEDMTQDQTEGTDPGSERESHMAKLKTIVEAALERNAHEPVVLDVGKLTSYADTLVILSGNSTRQVRAISSHVVKALKALDEHPLGVEGADSATWMLIDANDTIVHVFDPETRELFDIEGLWSDAPRIELDLSPVPSDAEEKAIEPVPHPAN